MMSLYLYYHTHWDREWYLPFREYQHRLLKVIDNILNELGKGNLPCFTLDGQTVVLEDYLEFRPENRDILKEMIKSGKISVGPWYVMPDEFLVSGESLIRNLERGIKIAREFGEETFTGYLPDTFGHSADIPMILRQFGIDSAIVWRGVQPSSPWFLWESPSGDRVLSYHLTDGYSQKTFHTKETLQDKSQFFQSWFSKVSSITTAGMPMLFPVGADHLGITEDIPGLMKQVAADASPVTSDIFMKEAQRVFEKFPSTASAALLRCSNPHLLRVNSGSALLAPCICSPNETSQTPSQKKIKETDLAVIPGELRDNEGAYILPGVFSARLYLKQWNRRLEWRLTRQLEQLLVWKKILGMNSDFPNELDFLWKTLLLNHPHDSICGCSIDAVHRENEVRFEQVDQFSAAMLRDAHHALRKRLQLDGSVLIINLSDDSYSGVVEIVADYPLSQLMPEPLSSSQILSEEEILDETFLTDISELLLSDNKAIRRRSLVWVSDVPPHGIKVITEAERASEEVTATDNSMENSYLRVTVTDNNDLTVEDLKHGHTYRAFHQVWRNLEQGDSYTSAAVPGAKPEQAKLVESKAVYTGPLRATILLKYLFSSIDLGIETLVTLDAASPRIDFKTSFINNSKDHKVQAVFNCSELVTTVTAEGHFSPITRIYDPDYRIEDYMPAPAQKELKAQSGPLQKFIGFQEQTIITEGLTEYEVEGHKLKLTLLRAFGMLSRSDTAVRGSHAGPPLPTPEGQCLNRSMVFRYGWLPGFDLQTAFHHSDRLYGAIYGFDRSSSLREDRPAESLGRVDSWVHEDADSRKEQHRQGFYTEINDAAEQRIDEEDAPQGPKCQHALSFFSWDNPYIHATAMSPKENSWDLRLLNPTSEPQRVKINIPCLSKTIETTISSYSVQTLRISLQ